MATLRLNKQLYTDINRLKLLNKSDEHGRFILEESPFDDDDIHEDGPSTATGGNRCITITGRIFPNTKIYNQGSYRIRLSLTPNYPSEPPTVKFITRIYHPNVATDGEKVQNLMNHRLEILFQAFSAMNYWIYSVDGRAQNP